VTDVRIVAMRVTSADDAIESKIVSIDARIDATGAKTSATAVKIGAIVVVNVVSSRASLQL
jgi:hypothetical protein